MYLSKTGWRLYTLVQLGLFGTVTALYLHEGWTTVGHAVTGAIYCWVLLTWARAHRDRRRGWRIGVNGDAALPVWLYTPDGAVPLVPFSFVEEQRQKP